MKATEGCLQFPNEAGLSRSGPRRSLAEGREGGIQEGSEDLSKGLGGPGNLCIYLAGERCTAPPNL